MRRLGFLEKGTIYDDRGERIFQYENVEDVERYLDVTKTCLFTGSFDCPDNLDTVFDFAFSDRSKVLADRKGKPFAVRIRGCGNSTRWIVQGKSWGIDCFEPSNLKDMYEFYDYIGIGYKPTPASLGGTLMRESYRNNKLGRHTSLSRAAEDFVRNGTTGGIVQTPGAGKQYDEGLMLDGCAYWISKYILHPTGCAVPFEGDPGKEFFTYFAECDVYIPSTLPLGPFPYKTGRSDKKRIVWPTEEGVYHGAYLWREQIDDCIRAGCIVKVIYGYGWREYTTDNFYWAEDIFERRKLSPNEFTGGLCKRLGVSAIGSQFRPREQYTIGPGESDRPVILGKDAYNLYLHEEYDASSALMVHWYSYTIAVSNSCVYQFALPFAKEGRLVAIDYDSVLIVEKDERHKYVAKKTIPDYPPGTWGYILLHNIRNVKDRTFVSDELSKQPGVVLS